MQLRTPQCGNDREAHPAHRFRRWFREPDPGSGRCDGWSPTEADVTAMTRDIRTALAAHEAGHLPGQVPPLVIEVAASVRYALLRVMIPGQADTDAMRLGDVPALFGIPITVTDLPPGRWRLVVPGPVLAGGSVAT